MEADRDPGLRPCHVYDYDGDYLGSFTTWSAAHEWAHLQAAMGGVQSPLEVEDEQAGQRHRVWVDRCAELFALAPPTEAGRAAGPATHGTLLADSPVLGGFQPLDGATLCNALDAPTFIPAQPRRAD